MIKINEYMKFSKANDQKNMVNISTIKTRNIQHQRVQGHLKQVLLSYTPGSYISLGRNLYMCMHVDQPNKQQKSYLWT